MPLEAGGHGPDDRFEQSCRKTAGFGDALTEHRGRPGPAVVGQRAGERLASLPDLDQLELLQVLALLLADLEAEPLLEFRVGELAGLGHEQQEDGGLALG
ncbi:hypothetical protein FLX07_19915 [Microbispora bryophytorum]|nr:hypothetical protein FLX07_19915 [Microbispora bryophytorum]